MDIMGQNGPHCQSLIQFLTDDWANKLGEYEIPRSEAGWTKWSFTSESNNGCENHDMILRCLWEMCCICTGLYIVILAEELHKILRIFPTVTTRYLNFHPIQELIYVCFWFISAEWCILLANYSAEEKLNLQHRSNWPKLLRYSTSSLCLIAFFRSSRNFVSRGLRPQVYVIW